MALKQTVWLGWDEEEGGGGEPLEGGCWEWMPEKR